MPGNFSFRALPCILFFSLLLPDMAGAQIRDIIQTVGVIQYNVKNHGGAWISGAPTETLKLQVQLIAQQVTARANENPPVDFIALEQSELGGRNADRVMTDGNIAHLLKNEGLSGWTMIESLCKDDVTQLAYSANWELVSGQGLQNPLVNSAAQGAPQRGWEDCTHSGRPYNIAYLNNKTTAVKVLFVITHLPHCHDGDFAGCLRSWRVSQLKADIRRVVGKAADLRQIHVVMAGDMNELGGSDQGSTFDPVFSDFGTLQISTHLETCCANDGYTNRFDRLLANSPTRPKSEILTHITATKEITYPLDPNFSARTNEEHKAIFGVVEFTPPKRP